MKDYAILSLVALLIAASAPATKHNAWDARYWNEYIELNSQIRERSREVAEKAWDFMKYDWLCSLEVADNLEKIGDKNEPIYNFTLAHLYELQAHAVELSEAVNGDYSSVIEAQKLLPQQI